MGPTVHEVRNAIRVATGRFEREFKTSFTQEELQAIYETFEIDVDETGRPSTTRMRRLIRAQVGIAESLEATDDSTFRKAELQAIADGVGASFES
jgi:arsenate reductase-like glutaredoxin family protein